MRHTRSITHKRLAMAQSAYASKLQFKQEASQSIAFNTFGLVGDAGLVWRALLGNALSLGVFWVFDDPDDTQS